MRIKRVECDQFAGLTCKELEFDKGLNIVVGENESGKSTIVDLIYQLLFKDVKLDGRSDSDFIDKYFPKKISGPQGDVIDGLLVFETPSGTYKLKKEWEKKNGTCKLTLPNGTSIKGNAAVNKMLSEELKHRAGVYGEIVFASQKRNQIAIESIMKALGKKADALSATRSDLTSTLTQAALETGGISLEKIENTIKKNMDELIGRWDWTADAPEGGAKRATYRNAWDKGAGTIVKAYYEADKVRSKQKDAESAELTVEAEKAIIKELQTRKKEVETEWTTFQRFRGMLDQRSLLSRSIKDLEERISEQKEAVQNWPKISSNIEKATELRKKKTQAMVHDLYLKAEPVHRSYIDKQAEFQALKEVDAFDVKNLRDLASKKLKEENKLAGMNLVAKIKELGSAEINVTSMASGKTLELVGGEVQITEAVNINIPGVMDMQLMPRGVDVEKVKNNLASYEAEIKTIYEKYGISSFDELQNLSDAYKETKQETERLQLSLEKILRNLEWEDIKAYNDTVPVDIETEDEINKLINSLCGSKTIDEFIGGLKSTRSDYENKYESTDKLKSSIEKLSKDKAVNQEKLTSMDEIPKKYQKIDDPDQYDSNLKGKIEKIENEIEDHNNKLRDAERNLGDKSAEEYSEELQDKEAVFNAKKTEYEHWMNIYRVFQRLKEQSAGNPVEDIEKKFREYLGVIASGNLHLNSMDKQMSVQLTSGSNALTYDTLSDGTKDTISLAFRLAMLEHLYPEGDGLAVFDDPFTDMDAKRVEQSCKLIEKFAENNQVVFVTCDHKYQDYMSGNVILLDR